MHVSRVYAGYITASLHGRLLGQREVFAILHNCIPLPSSALVGSPLPLSPYHLLYTLQLSVLSTLPSLLCGFLCQPFLPNNFYWLTNAVRWSWLACTLHKQPVCSYLGPFKTPRLHCHTHLHEIKHTQQCWTSLSHTESHTHSCTCTCTCTCTPLPGHGGPICRICQDLTGNGDQSQLSSYASLTCCCQKINPI